MYTLHNRGPNSNLTLDLRGHSPYWVLTVTVPVRYLFASEEPDPNNAASTGPAAAWTGDQMSRWKRRFAESMQRLWSRRWPLQAISRAWSGEFVRADVEVRIEEVGRTFRYHVNQIGVIRPISSSGPRTMHDEHQHRMIGVLENDIDAQQSDWSERPRLDAAHEFGHLLGLQHSCGDGNDTGDYGDPLSYASDGIMGSGDRMRQEYYDLFSALMEELAMHAHDDAIPRYWTVSHYAGQWDREPYNLRGGPATLGCQGRAFRSPASSSSWPPRRLY